VKIKYVFESILAGTIAAIFSYAALVRPLTLAALKLRNKTPEAWFASSIVLYADILVVMISIAVALSAFFKVYRHTTSSAKI
jgi:cell division protein FtsX